MILDIGAIPRDLLLLQLYNNALYQAPKFDVVPTKRQKVAGKKSGIPLVAATLIKERTTTQQYYFDEVDLGAGSRELNVDLAGFEVDFTQYDELHGPGTAKRVIKEIREAIAAFNLTAEDIEDNFLADVMIKVNQELLNTLNSPDEMDCAENTNVAVASIQSSNEVDEWISKLNACQSELERYFLDAVINQNAESSDFLKELQEIIVTRTLPKKFKDGRISEFYRAWLNLVDPNINLKEKELICSNLYKKYSDQDISFAEILLDIPKVVALQFVAYSSVEALYTYYECREKYKKFTTDTEDYFADLIKLIIQSPSFTEESKKHFLNHLLNFFKNLKELNAANPWANSRDEVKEALACWVVKKSLGVEADLSELNSLLSEEYFQIMKEFDIELASLLERVKSSEYVHSIRLDFNSYANQFILKGCFKKLDPTQHDRLHLITRHLDNFKKLSNMILDCKLQPNVILSNHALAVAKESYNHDLYPGLFINGVVDFLKANCSFNEFNAFVRQLAASLNPEFYAHEVWAFRKIREELSSYLIKENPETLIDAIKISSKLKSSTHTTPIVELVENIPSHYFNDQFLDALLKMNRLNAVEVMTFFSLCADEVQQQIITKLFKLCDSLQAIEKIKEWNVLYQESIFPTRFKEAFVKHLKNVNEELFDAIKSEQLFGLKDQSELARDLDNLKEILRNNTLTHDQRRSEIYSLKVLMRSFRDSDDACSVAIALFEAIPSAQWPYLFVYFDSQIIHWGFPHDKSHINLLKKLKKELPPERPNTWLNHLQLWEQILLNTLLEISHMKSDHSEEGNVAAWARGYVQEALSKTATYCPDFPNTLLKKFFLNDIVKSMLIFSKITAHSRDKYDFNEKFIVNDALIASWLPDNIEERVQFLSTAFSSTIVLDDDELKAISVFLNAPYVRNDREQDQLILHIVNRRKMHITNFLEIFNWENRKIIIQSLYKVDRAGTEALLVQAMDDIIKTIPEHNAHYFKYIGLLLSITEYTDIDLVKFVGEVSNKAKLVSALSNVDFWKTRSTWDLSSLFKLNSQLAPDNLYSNVTQYFERESRKYFSLYEFRNIVGAAEKIAIPPYQSYSEYLRNHPEESEKYIQLLLTNIKLFTSESDFKAMKFASAIIPDLDVRILKQLASEIKPLQQLEHRDKYADEKRKTCLDDLVQVYGVEKITQQCREYGLEKQATYLESKFKYYPQILDQVRVLCKWSKQMLNPEYRSSAKTKPLAWDKIHRINEKTLEVLSELACRDGAPDHLMLDQMTEIIQQICEKAKVSVEELSRALPNTSKDFCIKLDTNGGLFINGMFARDNKGNHLSKAGMKFADQYLSTHIRDVCSNIEEEFNKLDQRSQTLLHDKYLEKKEVLEKKCKL